jgi:CRP/FNR family transcriptional regulator, cyclic AMP receptor protein
LNGGGNETLEALVGRTFDCPPALQQHIVSQAIKRHWPQRATILHSGEAAQSVYLVSAGLANAVAISIDGRLVLVQQFGPGDIFGEGSILGDVPIEEDVVAAEAVQAAQFRALVFIGLIESHPCIALAVSRVLTQRLARANRRMVEGATLSASGRVHAELLRQARTQGGNTIRPAPVLSELALRVQTARETVSRTISNLEKRGIIVRDGECLTIVAPHRLAELVS